MCTVGGNTLVITFTTEHGDLPLLQPDFLPQGLSTMDVRISPYTQGSKEMIECSGRGLCSRGNGVCSCFSGYGSSDGAGGPGLYDDCGYIEPISV